MSAWTVDAAAPAPASDRLGHRSPTCPPRACARPPFLLRGAPRRRARTSASSSSATPCSAWSSPTTCSTSTPTCPKASSPSCARRSSTPTSLPSSPTRGRPRRRAAPRQGRGRVRRAIQAVDPRRRDGGGHRGGVPRRWLGRGRRDLVMRLLGDRIRAGGDGARWRRLQDAAPGARGAAVRPAPALPGAGRGPRPLEAVLRDGARSEARSAARARVARRSRPSKPPRVPRGTDSVENGVGGEDGAATATEGRMPELT